MKINESPRIEHFEAFSPDISMFGLGNNTGPTGRIGESVVFVEGIM